MPAPTANVIAANIENAFIANGLVKYSFDGNGNPVPTGQLTSEQKKMIKAIAEGINLTWSQWQASQTVVGSATVTSAPGVAPVTGNLP